MLTSKLNITTEFLCLIEFSEKGSMLCIVVAYYSAAILSREKPH